MQTCNETAQTKLGRPISRLIRGNVHSVLFWEHLHKSCEIRLFFAWQNTIYSTQFNESGGPESSPQHGENSWRTSGHGRLTWHLRKSKSNLAKAPLCGWGRKRRSSPSRSFPPGRFRSMLHSASEASRA